MPIRTPTHEALRLQALTALEVVGSQAEPLFDSIVRLLSKATDTPIALISLVTEDQQWFKASIGLPGMRSTARDLSFCAHAIEGPDILVIHDAALDARFSDNPLVKESPHIRFYAGAPLLTADGHAIGTLCAIDRVPRTLNADQLATLRDLAQVVTALLEARAVGARLQKTENRLHSVFSAMTEGLVIHSVDGCVADANPAAEKVLGLKREQLLGKTSMDPHWHSRREDGSPLLGEEHPAMVTLGTGKAVSNQLMNVQTSGTERRWININSRPLFERATKTLSGALVTFADVTAEKELTGELQRARVDLQSILDHVPARITSWRADLTCRFANRQAEAFFGLAPGAGAGKHITDILGAERCLQLQPYLDAALAGTPQATEYVERQHDGIAGCSRVEFIPQRDPEGGVGAYVVATDISELKNSHDRIRELAQRLEQVRELERRSIAMTLHEGIAQDLFAMSLTLKYLENEARGRTKVTAACAELTAALDKCMTDTRQVANDLQPAALSLLPVIDSIRQHAQYFGKLSQLLINVSANGALPDITAASRLLLFRAAQESLTNVARHARAHSVEIVLNSGEQSIEMKIVDDGIGIADSALSKAGSLGLFGLQERLRAVGGSLNARKNSQSGTTVSVILPIRAA